MFFRTTVINLDPSGMRADPTLGRRSVGELSREELIELLEAFRGIDPIENLEADPEVAVEARYRYVIRSGPGRLLLYNPRNPEEPAHVLTAEEIVAELDGSAVQARSRAPFPIASFDEAASTPTLSPPPPRPTRPNRARWPLAFAACALAAWLGHTVVGELPGDQEPRFEPLGDAASHSAHLHDLTGVFMTGPQPGDKGIALNADGNLQIFLVNAKSAPSTVRDSVRLGRIDGQLALAHSQPGGPILVTAGNATLRYCGEIYTRLK